MSSSQSGIAEWAEELCVARAAAEEVPPRDLPLTFAQRVHFLPGPKVSPTPEQWTAGREDPYLGAYCLARKLRAPAWGRWFSRHASGTIPVAGVASVEPPSGPYQIGAVCNRDELTRLGLREGAPRTRRNFRFKQPEGEYRIDPDQFSKVAVSYEVRER